MRNISRKKGVSTAQAASPATPFLFALVLCLATPHGASSVRAAAPIAYNQAVSVPRGQETLIQLLWTDDDHPPASSMTATILSLPLKGVLESYNERHRTTTYPAYYYFSTTPQDSGNTVFSWKISDGLFESMPATCTVSIVNNQPPVASDQSVSTLPDDERMIELVYSDPDTPLLGMTFDIRVDPMHGTLQSHLNRTGTPYPSRYFYTPTPGYFGPDLFIWRTTDGVSTSAQATCSISVVNRPPVAADQSPTVLTGQTTRIALIATDPDGHALDSATVSAPSHGILLLSGHMAYYTPQAGFAGSDSFAWRSFDGYQYSGPATCRVTVVETPTPTNGLVVLAVNHLLLPELTNEILRLKQDLERECHTVEILPWDTAAQGATNLWTAFRSRHAHPDPGSRLVGALLIGNMPKARSTNNGKITDLAYWNMNTFGETSVRHIWVSRLWALSVDGADLFAGGEAVLLKRALQANHDYRTGASRLPHTAFRQKAADLEDFSVTARARHVWPKAIEEAAHTAFRLGGDLLQETTHGDYAWYDLPHVHTLTLLQRPPQIRHSLCTSCSSGDFGGVVNNHLFARGGGAVLAIGAADVTYEGDFTILDDSAADQAFRARLAAGDSWGKALVTAHPFGESTYYWRTLFHGDLSLPPMAGPSNALPVITAFLADKTNGLPGMTVAFTAAATDPDGSILRYEWYPLGFAFGKVDPVCSGPAETSRLQRYDLPHRYLARLQVVDNWLAPSYQDIEIAVAPDSSQPLRVNCGRMPCPGYTLEEGHFTPGFDFTNASAQIWLHDQKHVAGTWGRTGVDLAAFGYSAKPVGNTLDDALFQSFSYEGTYRIPLSNGVYHVRLGFADMVNTAPGERRVDVALNSQPVVTGLDIVATAGADQALFLERQVTVAGGWLEITVSRNAGSPATLNGRGILNAFEIIPLSLDTDGDGIPDACDDDDDNDGMSDADELLAGTDPADPASCFALAPLFHLGIPGMRFPSRLDRLYTVEYSDDLLDSHGWHVLTNGLPGNGQTIQVPDTELRPRRYYRARAQHP